jgi:FKBP-type peptidyl-prolyl cis-trans isomerase
MLRLFAAALALGLGLSAIADQPKKDDKPTEAPLGKLPPLDAKEWKKVGDKGLEIWDVKVGEGTAVEAGGKVKVHYIGWLTNGKKFDSSRDRNEPIEFGLNQVIKGWQDGIPGMKPGSIRRLKIPSELGYGKRGAGADIPPDSVLVFEVELLK